MGLTIVIPLKDRIEYTRRLLEYMVSVCFPFHIVLADGSNNGDAENLLIEIANISDISIEYLRYKQDNCLSDYYSKMVDVLSRIRSDFVAVGDNDDFFLVDGLKQSLDFLKRNEDYVSCRGKIFSFRLLNAWDPEEESEDAVFGIGGEYKNMYLNESLEQESPVDRLRRNFQVYAPSFYNVYRSDFLRASFQLMKDADFSDGKVFELALSAVNACEGKHRVEPVPFLLRQVNSSGSWVSSISSGDQIDEMLTETWTRDYAKALDMVAGVISSNKDDSINVVREAFRVHLDKWIVASSENNNNNSMGDRIISFLIKRRDRLFRRSFQEKLLPAAVTDLNNVDIFLKQRIHG